MFQDNNDKPSETNDAAQPAQAAENVTPFDAPAASDTTAKTDPAPDPAQPDTDTDPASAEAAYEKLDAALAENAKLRDAYARSIADLENYRRRVTREKEDLRKFAAQDLIEDIIPILDNLTIGLTAAEKHPEAAPVTEGFKMIATQIKAALEQHGLVEINPPGEPFDPNSHESVSQTPHDTIPDHHVAAVLRIGYRLHDRLVRPATIVLSTGKTPASSV